MALQNIAYTPLLTACSIPGEATASIVELLLEGKANPNGGETDTKPVMSVFRIAF